MTNVIPQPMIPEPFRIRRMLKETHDTYTIELESTNGADGFPFSAGQFNMLYVFGVGEVPISISGNPEKPQSLFHTARFVGNVTKAMFKLRRGDVLGIRGPFGSHWPVDEAVGNDVVIVAGGIGLAPLRPALYNFISHREKYGKIILLYGARTPEDLLYKRELEQWRGRFDLEVNVIVDSTTGIWRGNVGVVTTLIPEIQFDPLHTTAMICGPEVMMRYTVKELQNCGVKNENIYVSMERNMKCGICLCGHCQLGSKFVCKDGPVFCYDHIKELFGKREI
ncbi:MAG TPA: FAD/NAD(P)-binding protein [Candidatus Wunengus sp. YC60]|uniref:FAD/NAD(P)-binding protein n=1 Tax=Candidatus Wunengus sp. YC60 TaxID=3367697 RepID=UPI00402726F0